MSKRGAKAAPKTEKQTADISEFLNKAREKRDAARDPKKHTHGAPAGYLLRGASTQLDADGNVISQWVKTTRDQIDPDAFLDAFRYSVLTSPPLKRARIQAPRSLNKDLLAVYPMGDPHLGMLSWHLETGADFDLQIAERNLTDAVDHLVSIAPPAATALIVNVGDFFHSDNQSNTTARSGHSLDVDGRWSKILVAGYRTMTRCIDRALEKHARVRVINEIGNHDDHTSVMLSVCLNAHYRNNPRVEIDMSPAPFHWFEFGKVLIGTHHGHSVKPERLPGVMLADQKDALGRTDHRYWYCGHFHTKRVHEVDGVIIEYFRTLAARDAWTNSMGYRSGRSMNCIVHEREQGEILRHQVGVEALKRAA